MECYLLPPPLRRRELDSAQNTEDEIDKGNSSDKYFVILKLYPNQTHLSPIIQTTKYCSIRHSLSPSLRPQELRLVMCIELSKLLIPRTNLFNSRINLFLKYIQLHIGGIVL